MNDFQETLETKDKLIHPNFLKFFTNCFGDKGNNFGDKVKILKCLSNSYPK